MKKLTSVAAVLLCCVMWAAAASGVSVKIDGKTVTFPSDYGAPYIDANSRTLVPLRGAMEAFGATVTWEEDSKTATVQKDDTKVQVTVGSRVLSVNGKTTTNDTSAVLTDGRVYLPIRAVLEAFGATVTWDGDAKTVVVSSQNSTDSGSSTDSQGGTTTDSGSSTDSQSGTTTDSGSSTDSQSGTTTDSGSSTDSQSGTTTDSSSSTDSQSGTTTDSGSSSSETEQGTVTASVLNVRSGAGTDYGVVMQLSAGAKVSILSSQSGWYQIALSSGGTGWVSTDYVLVSRQSDQQTDPQSVMNGNFMWIWNLQNCMNRYGGFDGLVAELRLLGVNNVCIKFHEGSSPSGGGTNYRALFLQYVKAFKDKGFTVGTWGYNYFNYVQQEADMINQALDNSDYYIFDAEDAVIGKTSQATQVCQLVRAKHPNAVLGYSSFPILSYHPNIPYQVFDTYCDFTSPQCYWGEMKYSVQKCVNKMLQDYQNYGLTLPIYPSIQSYGVNASDYSSYKGYSFSVTGTWDVDEMDQTFESCASILN